MYKINDYVICPGYGLGKIINIEFKNVSEEDTSMYLIQIIDKEVKLFIPTNSKDQIRSLSNEVEVFNVLAFLKKDFFPSSLSTWNRRQKEYIAKIRTGSLFAIAEVFKELHSIKNKKKLSFGEKKLLEQCKDLLLNEVALVQGNDKELLREIFE
jgi:CarD family transcriptional regulator